MLVSIFATSRRDRKRARLSTASLNGVDVTNRCQVADDKIGRVLLLESSDDGKLRRPARWHYGRVRIGRKTLEYYQSVYWVGDRKRRAWKPRVSCG
jgi:hypothetical protein